MHAAALTWINRTHAFSVNLNEPEKFFLWRCSGENESAGASSGDKSRGAITGQQRNSDFWLGPDGGVRRHADIDCTFLNARALNLRIALLDEVH